MSISLPLQLILQYAGYRYGLWGILIANFITFSFYSTISWYTSISVYKQPLFATNKIIKLVTYYTLFLGILWYLFTTSCGLMPVILTALGWITVMALSNVIYKEDKQQIITLLWKKNSKILQMTKTHNVKESSYWKSLYNKKIII